MDDQCLSEAKTDRVLAIYSRLVGGAVLNIADLASEASSVTSSPCDVFLQNRNCRRTSSTTSAAGATG